MNLEVDVMEGDEFTVCEGGVFQYRNNQFRRINFRRVSGVWCDKSPFEDEHPLDLPTFTRYCEGCGLTVKHIKPEPQVENINPPEWAVVWPDGSLVLSQCVEQARDDNAVKRGVARIVRIDWGAK